MKFILIRLFVTCRSIKNLPEKRDNQVTVSSFTQLKSYLRPGGADGEDTCHWNRNRPRPSDLCPSEKPASTEASGTLEWDACRNITTNPIQSLHYIVCVQCVRCLISGLKTSRISDCVASQDYDSLLTRGSAPDYHSCRLYSWNKRV